MTTEAWDEYYKLNLTWNHAWGSALANITARKLMGIEPVEATFSRLSISHNQGSWKRRRSTRRHTMRFGQRNRSVATDRVRAGQQPGRDLASGPLQQGEDQWRECYANTQDTIRRQHPQGVSRDFNMLGPR
jgi:hypothetical protein